MMTRYSDPSEFRTGFRADRHVLWSRAALTWERVWPALWPASGIAGLFAAAALFELFATLPWTAHALILSAVITGIGLCLYFSFRDVHLPDWLEGARQLERTSRLAHRPISEAGDRLAIGGGDALAEELWTLHLRRMLAGIGRLTVGWPAPGLARRDPRALRFVVLLLVLAGVAIAGSDSLRRLWAGFNDESAAGRVALDAWIDPPAYTGLPPVYLAQGATISVPAGSVLNLRAHGAGHAPGLAIDSDSDESSGFAGSGGEYSANARILGNSHVRVRSRGRAIGDWTFVAIPDKPPHIAFAAPPGKTEHQVLKLAYRAGDDYGVTAVRAIITPHGRHSRALVVDLSLPASAKDVSETAYEDLTAHPYAGLDVDIVLQAIDGAGQAAETKPVTYRLPARVFTNPLARALIEQRQNLATSVDDPDRKRVVRMLDALTIAPQLFYADRSGVYTAIRAARWGLANAARTDEVEHVENLLWDIAAGLERGGMLSAAEDLRRLQAMLAQALAQGAPQDVIDELLQRYNEAMQRYMQALAANPQADSGPPPPGTKVLSEQDLQALLKAIQQLAQSGARDRAQQMLALLQNMLENLRLSSGSGSGSGPQSPQNKALSDAIHGLGDLMGRQRELLDKTFKGRQGEQTDPKALQKEQGDIQKHLGDITKGLSGQNIPTPGELGRAGNSMGQSQQELSSKDFNGSSVDQKNALDAMRSGALDLANQLMKQMGQDSHAGDADPLGRNSNSTSFGNDVKVPGASQLQRARDILMELRRRAAERGRPRQELDYIDRLLKQF